MPPRKSQKSLKKEDVERQKKILTAKEKILAKKRFLLEIVEKMIEDDVNKDWFLNYCAYLCQADFNDVVQERSISRLCGYPLCSSLIKETVKQKYHISQVVNKVYDLTERKCFCSNHCYKAANYLREQLSSIPLYMRKEEKIKLHLLSDCDNRGSVGEEIQFHHKIPQEEINKVYSEETINNLENILNKEIEKCADSLNELQIKEHLFEKQFVFSDETPNKSHNSTLKDKSESHSESDLDSDDSVDEKFFPSYDNEKALSNRHMPVPQKIKKSVLIPPQKSDLKLTSEANELSLCFVRKVFTDWMTENTIKYLLGEKYVYGVKADHLFKTMTESEFPCSEKLAAIKEEYIKLCLKIDSLPDEDDDIIDSPEILINESNSKLNSKKIENENNSNKRVFKRRPKKSKDKKKHVTFAPIHPGKKEELSKKDKCESSEEKLKVDSELKTKESVELLNKKQNQSQTNKNISSNNDVDSSFKEKLNHDVEEKAKKNSNLLNENENSMKADETVLSNDAEAEKEALSDIPEPEPAFPLIDSDSVSQNIFRRQVLTKKLKSVYAELLPIAGLHYTDIRENVRKFVDSLSLTPTNIIYKPKEWKLISLVLFRMLTRTVLKELHDELQFAKLCEDPLIPFAVDIREIENLVCELVSTENIVNIH